MTQRYEKFEPVLLRCAGVGMCAAVALYIVGCFMPLPSSMQIVGAGELSVIPMLIASVLFALFAFIHKPRLLFVPLAFHSFGNMMWLAFCEIGDWAHVAALLLSIATLVLFGLLLRGKHTRVALAAVCALSLLLNFAPVITGGMNIAIILASALYFTALGLAVFGIDAKSIQPPSEKARAARKAMLWGVIVYLVVSVLITIAGLMIFIDRKGGSL